LTSEFIWSSSVSNAIKLLLTVSALSSIAIAQTPASVPLTVQRGTGGAVIVGLFSSPDAVAVVTPACGGGGGNPIIGCQVPKLPSNAEWSATTCTFNTTSFAQVSCGSCTSYACKDTTAKTCCVEGYFTNSPPCNGCGTTYECAKLRAK
jgi:hypothetical protein